MFHPEIPARAATASRRRTLVLDAVQQELFALIASELLFLFALILIARI